MTGASLRVEVVRPARTGDTGDTGDTAVVQVSGELDIATAPLLSARLTQLVDGSGAVHVVVDLSRLAFADLVGLGALLRAERELRSRGGRLVLREPSALVRRVVRVLRLQDRLPVEGG